MQFETAWKTGQGRLLGLGAVAVALGVLTRLTVFSLEQTGAVTSTHVDVPSSYLASLVSTLGFAALLVAPYPSSRLAQLAQFLLLAGGVGFFVVAVVKMYPTNGPFSVLALNWSGQGVGLIYSVFMLGAIACPVALSDKTLRRVGGLIATATIVAAGYATYEAVTGQFTHRAPSFLWYEVAGVPATLVLAWALARARSRRVES